MDNTGDKHGQNPAAADEVARRKPAAQTGPSPQDVIYLPDLSGG